MRVCLICVCVSIRACICERAQNGFVYGCRPLLRHYEVAIDLAMSLLPSPVFHIQSPGYPSVHVADALYLCRTIYPSFLIQQPSLHYFLISLIHARRACVPPDAAFRAI